MIGRLTGIVVAILAVFLVVSQSYAQSVRDRLEKDVVVATVDGQQILSSELVEAFQTLPANVQQRGLRTVYQDLLEQMIENRLLTIHGRLNNLAGDAEVKALVKRAEDSVIARIYLNRLIGQTITDAMMRKRYDELVKAAPTQEEVHARHILVDSEATAREVIGLIKGGKAFEEVAKTHSKDPAASQGGDLGYFRRVDMVKPFADAAFALKEGEMTQKPVKTEFGWHVIKVEDKRSSTPPPFERVSGQIARDLGRKIAADVLEQARGAAKIQRYSLDGQPLPPPGNAPASNVQTKKK